MEKSDLSLNTYVQYVEDFRFWVLAAGNAHSIPEKDIVKNSVSGLKPEVFREEIYSRAFETLMDVMAKSRHELVNDRDIIEISERITRPEAKNESKDSTPESHISKEIRELHQGSYWAVFC